MEKYKFRMADMMPNAWFFKLKKASPPLERETPQPYEPRRSSNYIPSHHETPFSFDPPQNSPESSNLFFSNLRLPPILTKLPKEEDEDDISSPSFRRYSKKIQSCSEFKYLSKSFPVVKFSSNPQRDFRESMEEMMRENSISSSKDLEELLACFLSLNSGEYHGDIFRAFEEIRLDLADRRRRESGRPRHCR